jgi:hypothetical protein
MDLEVLFGLGQRVVQTQQAHTWYACTTWGP